MSKSLCETHKIGHAQFFHLLSDVLAQVCPYNKYFVRLILLYLGPYNFLVAIYILFLPGFCFKILYIWEWRDSG